MTTQQVAGKKIVGTSYNEAKTCLAHKNLNSLQCTDVTHSFRNIILVKKERADKALKTTFEFAATGGSGICPWIVRQFKLFVEKIRFRLAQFRRRSRMDSATCTEEDYANLNISVLRLPTRERLSCMLNAKKVLPSPQDNLPRDWRGLCTLLNYTIPSGCDPTDPIGKIFKFCELKTTVGYFVRCLEQIDRYDVVFETEQLIASDIVSFKERQCTLANPVPVTYNDFDANIITLDDLKASESGSPLPRYNAFLLFHDADVQSAYAVVKKLETDYNFKLCLKDRDLRPGIMFEYQSIIRLIYDRCDWLITIVSNDFLNSPWNRFIINYIQTASIEQRVPKMIPCVFGDCLLPQELKCYVHLFFNKHNPFCDPWNKLKIALSPNTNRPLTNNTIANEGRQLLKIRESMNNNRVVIAKNEQEMSTTEEQSKPAKNKNVFDRVVKNVGKILPQKWNKKKIKCASL